MLLTRNASAPEPKPHHQQKISLYSTQSTHGSGMDYERYQHDGQGAHLQSQYQASQQMATQNQMHPLQNTSLHGVQKEFMPNQQVMQHQPMHKTMSDSFVWSSNPMCGETRNVQNNDSHQPQLTGKISSNVSSAISPLIGASSIPGVWETNNIELRGNEEQENLQRNLGPIGSRPPTERSQESLDTERLRIYNHLTALFPKEQVIQAMTVLPEERNPEQICKYIIYLKNSGQ